VKHEPNEEDLNNYEEITALKSTLSHTITQYQKTERLNSAARLAVLSQERRASQIDINDRGLATIDSNHNCATPALIALEKQQESVKKQC
jgi:hypothetical protein